MRARFTVLGRSFQSESEVNTMQGRFRTLGRGLESVSEVNSMQARFLECKLVLQS